MSIETFISSYPADSQFATDITKRPEYGVASPVHIMADIYIREGSQGMRGAVERISVAWSAGNSKQLSSSVHESIMLNSYGVLLGTTVRSIEEMIADHTFDQLAFNARLESAFIGSGFNPSTIENPIVENVDERRVRDLIEVAKNDKTFGDFFKSGFRALSPSLRAFLIIGGMPGAIDLVLPGFITRTSLLISARNQTHAEIT